VGPKLDLPIPLIGERASKSYEIEPKDGLQWGTMFCQAKRILYLMGNSGRRPCILQVCLLSKLWCPKESISLRKKLIKRLKKRSDELRNYQSNTHYVLMWCISSFQVYLKIEEGLIQIVSSYKKKNTLAYKIN
jgi:hypothetical protein